MCDLDQEVRRIADLPCRTRRVRTAGIMPPAAEACRVTGLAAQ